MKVRVTKNYDPIHDNHYFMVSSTDKSFIKCFSFNTDNTHPSNEGAALYEAMKLANRIESTGSVKPVSEVVYESPE